jgi:toxin HigB-1
MIIEFEKEYLRELYEEGKVSSRKYRFQPQLILQYIKTVDVLRSASDIEFLYIKKFALRKEIR